MTRYYKTRKYLVHQMIMGYIQSWRQIQKLHQYLYEENCITWLAKVIQGLELIFWALHIDYANHLCVVCQIFLESKQLMGHSSSI